MKNHDVVKTMALILVILCPLAIVGTVLSPEDPAPKRSLLTASELREDLLQLREAFESMHPARYKFARKKDMDQWFESRLAMIDQPMEARGFYPILATFFGMVGCGHTRLSLPDGFWQDGNHNMLPLKLYLLGKRFYVVGHFSENQGIPIGSQIVSINGEPIETIIRLLKQNIHADAMIDTFKTRRLQKNFAHQFALQFGFHDYFEFTFIPPGKKSVSSKIRLKAVSLDMIKSERWNIKHQLNCEGAENYAVMTLNSFSSYPSLDRVKEFLDDSFSEISAKQIKHLIIDLRQNTGGDPHVAAHLLTYLEPRAIVYFDQPYEGYEALAKPLSPATRNHFDGDIYILIDGEGFSTTGHICALFKFHHIGTLIGEELGSSYICNDNSQNLVLKHSRFKVRMPTRSYAVAVEGISDRHGIFPDYFVNETIEDVITGRDTVLEFTLRLIRDKGD